MGTGIMTWRELLNVIRKKLEYRAVSLASFYRMIQNGHFCCSTTVRMYGTTHVGSRQQSISLGFWNKTTVCNVFCCTFSSTVSGVCFTDRQACLSWLVIVNQLKSPSLTDIFFLSFTSIILVCNSCYWWFWNATTRNEGVTPAVYKLQAFSFRPKKHFHTSSRFMTEVFCKPNRQMTGKPIRFVVERESLIILWWFLLGSLCPFYLFFLIKNNFIDHF